MKERMESPTKNVEKLNRNPSFLEKSAKKLSKSREKIPPYEYSEEKNVRELEHVFFKTYS